MVVPRHANALKLNQITVDNATNGSAGLVHDVCFTLTKKATEANCGTATRNLKNSEASFFTQAVSAATTDLKDAK